MSKRILIVGGSAGGPSAATRARRLDEHAEIVLFERGEHVSFASCGLPYHVGDVVPDASSLLLVTPADFRDRHGIDVRIRHEVVDIDRGAREVAVRDLTTGRTQTERYDALVLATGARALRPSVPGVDQDGVFSLRSVPDTQRVRRWIAERGARRAVVVGGGFIGVEVAENLVRRGLEVTVLEMQPQVLAPLDPEMAAPLAAHLEENGVRLVLGDGLARIDADRTVRTTNGLTLPADLVVLALGAAPNTALAARVGLETGARGALRVGDDLRTSDPFIWAVGDAIETPCVVTGRPRWVPLAGPANRQGRTAADAICGRPARFRGVQGTSVCGAFGLTAATTGTNEKQLRAEGVPHEAVWLHPRQHASWFPGSEAIHLKLVYRPEDGRILGAQAVGRDGVEKRIDVIATAMQFGGTVEDLEEAELAYAPQYGAAKDPVNVAGMLAANRRRGDLPLVPWRDLPDDAFLVDVRERHEHERGHVPGARNLPLSELRDRLDELPRDRTVWLYCQSGKRSYDAARALAQRGFDVRTLAGGMVSWGHHTWRPAQAGPATPAPPGGEPALATTSS